MTETLLCPPPDPKPRPPKITPHSGATDCHAHVFEAGKYVYQNERSYTPPDSTIRQLRTMHKTLGIERLVVVAASVHGTNNNPVLDAIATDPKNLRGIASVGGDTVAANSTLEKALFGPSDQNVPVNFARNVKVFLKCLPFQNGAGRDTKVISQIEFGRALGAKKLCPLSILGAILDIFLTAAVAPRNNLADRQFGVVVFTRSGLRLAAILRGKFRAVGRHVVLHLEMRSARLAQVADQQRDSKYRKRKYLLLLSAAFHVKFLQGRIAV